MSSNTVITEVPVELIHPHPSNPRRDLGDLTELTESIRAQGVRQNLLIVPNPATGTWTVVIGHRRLVAATEAGLTTVPCVIDDHLTPTQQLELMLVENLQRADLTPIEEATGYQDLLDFGMTAANIRKATGRARSTVKARLRLLELPEAAQARVHEGQATLEDAARAHKLLDQLDEAPDATESVQQAVNALGTTSFDWQAKKAEEDIKALQDRAAWVTAIEAHGIPRQSDKTGQKTRTECWVYNKGTLNDVLAAPAPEGATWQWHGTYIGIEIPATHVEDEGDEGEGDWPTERDVAAERAKLAQDRADADLAAQLRKDFLRGFLQRSHVTARERAAIWQLVYHAPGRGPYRMRDWLKDNGLDEGELTPQQWLLALITLTTDAFWHWRRPDDCLADLYVTLDAIGYSLSTTEQGWLDTAMAVVEAVTGDE